MDAHLLLVEDDDSIRESTALGLQAAGFEVSTAVDGDQGLVRFGEAGPDLVLLDVMLPGRDGLEVCRAIRRLSAVPVIMLTARADASDVVEGLEAGADDYVTKPFEMAVLVARIRASLRRVSAERPTDVIQLGDVTIDVPAHVASRAGQELALSNTEFRLLVELARAPGRVFSREMLLERVWDYTYLGDSRLVDVAVQRLRAKVERDPQHPVLVQTVRGAGYRAAR